MRTANTLVGSFGAVALALCGSIAMALAATPARQISTGSSSALDRSFLDAYCAACHAGRRAAGGLAIDALDLEHVGRDAPAWERVARQLRSGTMPPAGSARPDRAKSRAVAAALEAEIDRAAAAAPRPGRPVVRRLNRYEYANAIRDLLAVEIDAASLLPADESIAGFDNIGGALSLSPSLLDRYLTAARTISRLAVGDRQIGPAFASRTYNAPQTVFQDARIGEDLPFGSRGGLAVRHHFPLDAEYVSTIRLSRNIFGYVRGLTAAHTLEVRLEGVLLVRVTIGGNTQLRPAPLSFTGVIAGEPKWEAYALTADEGLNLRFRAAAGTHVVTVSFVDEPLEVEGVLQPELTGLGLAYSEFASAPSGPWGPAIDSVAIDGPYNPTGTGDTPSRRRLFSCRPQGLDRPIGPDGTAGDVDCARTILSALARRAYRGRVTDADLAPLLEFFRGGSRVGGFDAGMQAAIERLLVEPRFLFRIERDPADAVRGSAYRIDDVELATRLSFFLWSSIPDHRLAEAAERTTLRDPATLDLHVRRMLADERARALIENFAVQWLGLRQLRPVTLDAEIFPEYDGNLRDAFLTETQLFLRDQLRGNRSVLELLTAKYTFVNDRLARHYGMRGVYGSHFRRVEVSDDRAGLLGHGSILTATSHPTRTSPVLRGRWILENVLGAAPPPPPPDVPSLPSRADGGKPLTVRERTERHRANPACVHCHARMDPLGFALEPFDAIGRRRVVDDTGDPIDASGAFPDGTTFRDLAGLRALVTANPDDFVRTLTAKLMTYALGRVVQDYDMPAIRRIVSDAAPNNYRWSDLMLGIARSVPFQMKQAEP
jgi:hypothetical protein